MLKSAIDVYNYLLDLLDFLKKPTLKFKSLFLGACMMGVLGLALSSVLSSAGLKLDDVSGKSDNARAATVSNEDAPEPQQSNSTTGGSKPTVSPQQATQATGDGGNKPDAQQESTSNKSFRLSVTKDSKFDVGTMVAYDASKNEKTYYAGDLKLSATAVTISKSAGGSAALRISSPDANVISPPTEATDDNLTNVSVSIDASQSTDTDDGYHMIVDADNRLATGSYVLHISALRSNTTDLWLYHGFITVNVVD